MVIDLFPLSADEVRDRFPKVYQHVVERVKPERDQNNRKTYRENWWVFGEPRSEFRPVLKSQSRYIATAETSRHRFFQFLNANIAPDNKLIGVGLSDGSSFSILSSRVHAHWSIYCENWMGVGNDPVYAKTKTFDPFPFPLIRPPKGSRSWARPRLVAQETLAEYEFLTMTSLYNVLERVRELENGWRRAAPRGEGEGYPRGGTGFRP